MGAHHNVMNDPYKDIPPLELKVRKSTNWIPLYNKAVEDRFRQKFVLGKTDCIPCILGIVQEYTGVDMMEFWHGTYDTKQTRAEIVASLEGGLLGVLRRGFAYYGLTEVPVRQACRGDVAFLDYTPENDIGFCQGLGIFDSIGILTPAKVGFMSVDRDRAQVAWKIT